MCKDLKHNNITHIVMENLDNSFGKSFVKDKTNNDIDGENRTSQEEFSCIECGYESNADFNAAINIKNRVSEVVLCNKLLKQMDNGTYEPRKLKKEKVKEVLLLYRTKYLKHRESNIS